MHSKGPAVICSLATGRHRQMLAETAPCLLAYARRHGWDAVISCELLEPDRPASWSKIKLASDLIGKYNFVFWVDADAVIVDLDRDILEEAQDDGDFWLARHGPKADLGVTWLNAGVFVARSSQFTRDLLDAIWRSERLIDHNWWENAALLDVLGYSLEPPFQRLRSSDWQERIKELDVRWNSVPGFCESPSPALNHHARSDHGDFDVRLEGLAKDRRWVEAKFEDDFY